MAQTKKYLIFMSYIGSGFRGSQIQILKKPNALLETVQYVIERALKNLYNLEGERPISVRLASRTDKGVHALKAALTVNLPIYKSDFLQPHILVKHLNSYISNSKPVRILEAQIVPDSFHFSKVRKEKTYLYRLGILQVEYFDKVRKKILPITEYERAYLYCSSKTFDLEKAQEAAHLFVGVKDFGAVLGKPSKNLLPTVCNITSFKVEESQPLLPLDPLSQKFNFYHFTCVGDRFLFHMVRRMVSLCLSVGYGYIDLKQIQKLFNEPVPSSWPEKGNSVVPGCGLYLLDTKIYLDEFIQNEEHDEKKNDELSEKKNDELFLKNNNEEIIQ